MALGVTVLGLRTIGMWGLLSRAGFDAPTSCNGEVDVYPLQYRVRYCNLSVAYICAEGGPAVAAGGSAAGRRLGRELVAESAGRESSGGGAGPLRQVGGAHSATEGLPDRLVRRLQIQMRQVADQLRGRQVIVTCVGGPGLFPSMLSELLLEW